MDIDSSKFGIPNELYTFRVEFCKQAAAIGCTPSELLDLYEKQASGFKDIIDMGKGVIGVGVDTAKNIGWAAILAAAGVGALGGGLAAYGVNEFRSAVDPEDELFGSEDKPLSDIKKIQLIAKYRNAKNKVNKL